MKRRCVTMLLPQKTKGGRLVKKSKHKPYLRLKAALQEKNISYRALAKLLDISPAAVSDKINGKSDFLISEALSIESALKIPKSVFLPEQFRK